MATMNFGGTVAARVEADASGGGGAPVDPVRYFPDPALEAAVRIAVDVPVGDIHQSDLDLVTTFTADSLGIVDITGMEYWTTLTTLYLNENSIVNISPLASLIALQHLEIAINNISDISPLTSLIALTYIELGLNSIVDIPDLASLTSLTFLGLSTNSIVDILDLASLTSLTGLDLTENSIIEISSLSSLTSLEYLYLGYNSIVDILDLASLTSLIVLQFMNNNISDIPVLASLTSLEELAINNNTIKDISLLVGLSSGAILNAENLPLNVHAYSTDIPALETAGVTVYFDAEPDPTAISILPASGTTAGGTPVTITGANFLDGATVTIDGEPCTDVVFVNSGSLTAVTPAGTAGAKDVVVTNDVEYGTLVEGYTYT